MKINVIGLGCLWVERVSNECMGSGMRVLIKNDDVVWGLYGEVFSVDTFVLCR